MLGRDRAKEAYRVATAGPDGRIVGLIPDTIISRSMPLTGGRGHQTAYEWLAKHSKDIETALYTLHAGQKTPRAPFDRMTLEEDA